MFVPSLDPRPPPPSPRLVARFSHEGAHAQQQGGVKVQGALTAVTTVANGAQQRRPSSATPPR